MELFCQFRVHDYMDEYPEKHVRSFVANDEESIRKEAIKYAQHMIELTQVELPLSLR